MGGTVTVACKVPNGLDLRIFHKVADKESGPGGQVASFEIMRPNPAKPIIHINGCGVEANAAPTCRIIGKPRHGYALTENVDADLWEEWFSQNHDSAIVKNGLIWALDTPEDAAAWAKERKADIRSGLEPITPDKDWRTPKSVRTMTKKEDE